MILLIDNYDSFTWNLYHAMAKHHAGNIEVIRNDALNIEQIVSLAPSAVVISPGPGHPKDAGVTPALFDSLPEKVPMLGVCLGHQALCEHYGARLVIDPVPFHGKQTKIEHRDFDLCRGMSKELVVGRYHSITVDPKSLPECLKLGAWTPDGLVMAVQHATLPRFGLQFHPESILTPDGEEMVKAFLERVG